MPLRSGEPLSAWVFLAASFGQRWIRHLVPLLGRKIDDSISVMPRSAGFECVGGDTAQRRHQQEHSQKVRNKSRNQQ